MRADGAVSLIDFGLAKANETTSRFTVRVKTSAPPNPYYLQ